MTLVKPLQPELVIYATSKFKVLAALKTCNRHCKDIKAYTRDEYLLKLAQFYTISPDFNSCHHKLIIEVFDSLDAKDVKEITTFVEDVKCKNLFGKIFKKPRKSKSTTDQSAPTVHLTSIFRCLQEFLFLTGQADEAEAVSSCKLYKELSQFLSTQVNDSDFSFTSLEEDEFCPSHDELFDSKEEEVLFVEDFSSSDLSFI